MISVLIRVAGGARLGFGHLRRCWTLGARLRADGAVVRFVTTTEERRVVAASAGFEAVAESAESSIAATTHELQRLAVPRIAVVDDPELRDATIASLRPLAPVVCFDDNGDRPLHVDVVVNGSAGAEALLYRGVPEAGALLGPRYIVLREAFASAPPREAAPGDIGRVLVLGGGADIGGMTVSLLRVVLDALPGAIVDVVRGPFAPPLSLDAVPPSAQGRVRLHHAPEDVAGLMRAADLAVSGGGQTAYELAASGTPTLGIRLASDQALNLRGLAAAGCLRDLGDPAEPGFDIRLAAALRALGVDARARAEMGRRGRELVDGHGAERVADSILRLVGAVAA